MGEFRRGGINKNKNEKTSKDPNQRLTREEWEDEQEKEFMQMQWELRDGEQQDDNAPVGTVQRCYHSEKMLLERTKGADNKWSYDYIDECPESNYVKRPKVEDTCDLARALKKKSRNKKTKRREKAAIAKALGSCENQDTADESEKATTCPEDNDEVKEFVSQAPPVRIWCTEDKLERY